MRPLACIALLVVAGAVAITAFAAPSVELKARAERGEAAAQLELAKSLFEAGRGGDEALAEAMCWAERAAAQGHVPAYELIASACTSNQGKLRDIAKAVAYLRKLESSGAVTPRANALLGLLHHQGRGLPLDRVKGAALIAQSAAAGDEAGREFARELKQRGHLGGYLPMDRPDPALLRRAEDGDAAAQLELAVAYNNGWIESPQGRNPGKEWRERAAENGSAEAQLHLAEGYLQGAYGYAKNVTRGLRWLKRAADQGHARALWRIGEIHFDGTIAPSDDRQAADYLQRAAAAGVKDAGILHAIMIVAGRVPAVDPKRGEDLLSGAEERDNISARRYLLKAGLAGKFAPRSHHQMRRLLEQGVEDGNGQAKGIYGLVFGRAYRGASLPALAEGKVPFLLAAARGGDSVATRAYLGHLEGLIGELRKPDAAAGMGVESWIAALTDIVRERLAVLVLYGCHGDRNARLQAARRISGFRRLQELEGLGSHEMPEAVAWQQSEYVFSALALVRIYRKEGGADPQAIGWLGEMEESLREARPDALWEGEIADVRRLDAKQAELEKIIAGR